MKLAIGLLALIWVCCGLAGAWWLGDRDLRTVARGPISLAEAYNDNPINYPGPY